MSIDRLKGATLDLERASVQTVPWEDMRTQRRVATGAMVRAALPVVAERDRLRDLLERKWAWLDAHREDPRYAEREDSFIRTLDAYMAVCDALNAAEEAR